MGPVGNMLLGRPIEFDDSMPRGVVTFSHESSQDRWIRRAREQGVTVNVMEPEAFRFPLPPPAPAPTLGRLLRHWFRWPR
jgi:hypothetical protein